ncbi:hypothetical protein [Brevibacillus borstelensis]|uniref:hypothetical protein n=1 Tax=Brevibacillus borstelensis TaxID=45462 RepID=UPI0003A8E932|nr:hypothetical protein [Brevibacillus borstelensis]
MKVTDMDIFVIENEEKKFGEFTVKRRNMDTFEVIQDGKRVFEGEDFEVADFINDRLN